MAFKLHELLEKSTFHVADLALCELLLSNDTQYPWFILVPKLDGIEEIYQMSAQQQALFIQESSLLSEVLNDMFSPDKLNVAAIGNICPQLHVHHIARYKTDVAWPNPVWGFSPAKAYEDSVVKTLIEKVNKAIKVKLSA